MRCIALLLLVVALPAAVESFTLKDGRTFVGEYDDEAGKLRTEIAGKVVELAVPKEQIAGREPYRIKEASAAEPEKAAPPKAMTPEEKAKAQAAFAAAEKERQVEALLAAAAKAERQAAKAVEDAAERKRDAELAVAKFKDQARQQNQAIHCDGSLTEVVVRTENGLNNAGAVKLWQDGARLEKKAEELKALAAKKRAEADSLAGATP